MASTLLTELHDLVYKHVADIAELKATTDELKSETKDMSGQLRQMNESLTKINTTLKNMGWFIGTAAVIAPTVVMVFKG